MLKLRHSFRIEGGNDTQKAQKEPKMAEDYITKRLAELQKQLVDDAAAVVRGVFGAEGSLQSDVQQIKDLAQMRKEKLLREDDLKNN